MPQFHVNDRCQFSIVSSYSSVINFAKVDSSSLQSGDHSVHSSVQQAGAAPLQVNPGFAFCLQELQIRLQTEILQAHQFPF